MIAYFVGLWRVLDWELDFFNVLYLIMGVGLAADCTRTYRNRRFTDTREQLDTIQSDTSPGSVSFLWVFFYGWSNVESLCIAMFSPSARPCPQCSRGLIDQDGVSTNRCSVST